MKWQICMSVTVLLYARVYNVTEYEPGAKDLPTFDFEIFGSRVFQIPRGCSQVMAARLKIK